MYDITRDNVDFISEFNPSIKPADEDLCFILQDDRILLYKKGKELYIPSLSDMGFMDNILKNSYVFGNLDGQITRLVEYKNGSDVPEGVTFFSMREIIPFLKGGYPAAVSRAYQLNTFFKTHRYCGSCGKKTEAIQQESAVLCKACELTVYPRIAPAVIVAVTKGDKILLASSPRFKNEFYSVLAGFVEAGETLEECVKREIKEEVNIVLKNIRYFGSQSWPFPNSLMVGFTAEYESGDIIPEEGEIEHADWFGRDNLPIFPGSCSISHYLIEWFRNGCAAVDYEKGGISL